MHKVIIIGGGVAGMSAAHELIERGFEVQVFERKMKLPGGKARSVAVPHDGVDVHKNPLPGEHGFRFFPGFYKHIIDTMRRIPFERKRKRTFAIFHLFKAKRNSVYDNLVSAPYVMIARQGFEPIIIPDRFPRNLKGLKMALNVFRAHTGLTPEDKGFFVGKIWQLITSCYKRRENDYERIGWWEFTGADGRDQAYSDLFTKGLTRTLVASRAQTASTKTGGDIFLQLIFNMVNPTVPTDRILNGPTNERWLHPWLEHLKAKNVDFNFRSDVVRIDCDPTSKKITGVWVREAHHSKNRFTEAIYEAKKFTADYYILAVPVEVAAPLLIGDILNGQTIPEFTEKVVRDAIDKKRLDNPEVSIADVLNEAIGKANIMKADPCLSGIIALTSNVSWMTGVQFYLNQEVILNKGHIIFSDSPWAITAISQLQFWKNFKVADHGDGKVKSILSCDVSDWDTPGILEHSDKNGVKMKKTAKQCTREEIKDEVWAQMKRTLMQHGKPVLYDEMINTWFIDRDIKFEGDHASANENTEPLLVNKVDTWRLRPNSYSHIDNLFFAADYVRTHTDLATMEGANEAARRAVNNIIDVSGVKKPLCKIWTLHEPWIFRHLRKRDWKRYQRGLDWNEKFPWWVKLILWIIKLIKRLFYK